MTPWSGVERLADHHQVSGFSCGLAGADAWIQDKARREAGRVATHVCPLREDPSRIAAFFALKMVAIRDGTVSKRLSVGEDAVAALICWLGIDEPHQGKGLFRPLITDVFRTAAAAHSSSPFSLLVLDADNAELAEVYTKVSFRQTTEGSLRMAMKLSKVRAAVEQIDR